MITDTDQSELRDDKGRFKKGSKPKNGFNKNPQNIAPGGLWRYKEHGKAAIIGIFRMSVADFNKLKEIEEESKTVLDEVLFVKFKSAMAGNSKDADFLFNQAFGEAPKYKDAREEHEKVFAQKEREFFEAFSKQEVEELLKKANA